MLQTMTASDDRVADLEEHRKFDPCKERSHPKVLHIAFTATDRIASRIGSKQPCEIF